MRIFVTINVLIPFTINTLSFLHYFIAAVSEIFQVDLNQSLPSVPWVVACIANRSFGAGKEGAFLGTPSLKNWSFSSFPCAETKCIT